MAMMNERTSKRVARIAGSILAAKIPGRSLISLYGKQTCILSGSDLNAVAASALTQTRDKRKGVSRLPVKLNKKWLKNAKTKRRGKRK